jgi:hypothetical protein
MDPNSLPSRGRNGAADAYWRRRFFTLVAGLGILGLLAWATSGAVGGKPAHQSAASGPGGNGNVSAAAYGSAAPGQPAAGAATPSALPSAQASVSLPASPSPSATASATAPAATGPAGAQAAQKNASASQAAKARAAAGQPGGACPARDIVLTLSVGKPAYARGVQPAFLIDIVSTDAATCAFDTGRKSLRIVITGGTRATWDSGACLRGATAHVEHLRRGVPAVASIVWDRRLRPAGCTTPEIAAPPGQYQAMAVDGSAVSPARAFWLR